MIAEFKKYPKTMHLPWSLALQNDDKMIESLSHLESCTDVVVTMKMDGENTAMTKNKIHARSLDSRHHPSRNWVKALHGTISRDIPEGYKFFGENLYAVHSIKYDNLKSYFYLFHVLKDDKFLAWDEVKDWASLLGLETVPEIYRGKWDDAFLKNMPLNTEKDEGFVVRDAGVIPFEKFDEYTAKWVRSGHVQTDEHWMNKPIVSNNLGFSP